MNFAEDTQNDFLNYLILTRGVRESTAILYRQNISLLARSIPKFSKGAIETFLIDQKVAGRKNQYLNKFILASRIYCAFLEHVGQKADPSILTIKTLKIEASEKGTLSDSEILQIINCPPLCKGEKYKKRWELFSLFFKILAFSGLRPIELAKMTVSDVDFGRNVFVISEVVSKTHSYRLVPIAPNILTDVKHHVTLSEKYLFPAKKDSYMYHIPVINKNDWVNHFKRRTEHLGIKRPKVTCYSLRHSFITTLLEEDVSFPKVMKIAGHRNYKTTLNYTHMTTKDIQSAITKHPLIRRATDPRQILDAFKEIIRSFEFDKNERFKFSLAESGGKLSVDITIL